MSGLSAKKAPVICENYKAQVSLGLKVLLRSLNGKLEREAEATSVEINNCVVALDKLKKFHITARSLK